MFLIRHYDYFLDTYLQEQLQQKWASNWYVSYERFHKDEKYMKGTCVARKSRKEWLTIPCERLLPFVCEVSKGM